MLKIVLVLIKNVFLGLKKGISKLLRQVAAKPSAKEWKRPIVGLIRRFPSIDTFFNGDLNKFILLLRKGFKEAFYSELNLKAN